MIPTFSLCLIGMTAVFSFLFPIVIGMIWIKKSHRSMKSLLIGAMVFILSIMVLESSFYAVVAETNHFFSDHPFLYILCGCLTTALFEEGGRYFTFKKLLKKEEKADSVTYGIGHGGIEWILTVGISLMISLMFGLSFNSVGIDGMLHGIHNLQTQQAVNDMIMALQNYHLIDAVMNMTKQISIFILQISCSVFVFKAVRTHDNKKLWIAMIFHAAIYIPTAMLHIGLSTDVRQTEILLICIGLLAGFFGSIEYKK